MNDGKTGAIFLLHDDETLTEVRETNFASEDLLQRLLADHPTLMAGELMNRNEPRRWLLVRREAGVPSREEEADRWSMDHLFLDQEGIPTLVEVKRSTDTRIRREVVGQMLDYAANALRYWPTERIRMMFEETCKRKGVDADSAVLEVLESEWDIDAEAVEDFWQNVERNFQAHRIRMVFVADIVPPELQRIVEFLNEQMNPSEVLAVEVRQYVGNGPKTLVPRVYGLTAEAQRQKHPSLVASPTDEPTFLGQLSEDYAGLMKDFFDTCTKNGLPPKWGTTGCSIRSPVRDRSQPLSIAWVNPPGKPGWMGLTDVPLGVDLTSAAKSAHLQEDVETYQKDVAAIPGAKPIVVKNMQGYSFSGDDFARSRQQITEVLLRTAERFKGSVTN